ncbi:Threonine/homoserine/homoserine lactone efflux protein [Asanoa hainanensis]|uniref:Threonine/homoserine/homoserine lactone efflux protein n=1 Tax=Asanoa hainanensis TaxID=560556 RepID=A0A239GDG0_9ACTN|nr:LysE family translocator [Asanoa hainanensis]SNS66955.1 Threonine/homoserine/homoserine lactone efflux protein [Asanoa hainanensis]
MSWSAYGSFVVFAIVLIAIPGADFAVTVRSTLVGGRRQGQWTAAGITSSNVVQGLLAVAGLGAIVVRVEPVFQAVKWAGIGYLLYLAAQSFRSAVRGDYAAIEGGPGVTGTAWTGWRQGFLSNITNPKVLVFYLAVLPQFLGPGTPVAVLVVFALTHAALGLLYSLLVVAGLHRVHRVLSRRRVRRALDAATGAALTAFGARLAAESA